MEQQKPLNVFIPKPVHRAIRILSLDREVPMSVLVREALEAYLGKQRLLDAKEDAEKQGVA